MPRDTEQLTIVVPAGWRAAIKEAAGGESASFIRYAIRAAVKRRTKRDLPGELKRGRPKREL